MRTNSWDKYHRSYIFDTETVAYAQMSPNERVSAVTILESCPPVHFPRYSPARTVVTASFERPLDCFSQFGSVARNEMSGMIPVSYVKKFMLLWRIR